MSDELENEYIDYSKSNFSAKIQMSINYLTDDLEERGFTIKKLDTNLWSHYAGRDTHSIFDFDYNGILLAFGSPFGDHFAFFISFDGYDNDYTVMVVNTSTYNIKRWSEIYEDEADRVVSRCAEIIFEAANPFGIAQEKYDKTDNTF